MRGEVADSGRTGALHRWANATPRKRESSLTSVAPNEIIRVCEWAYNTR